MAKNTSWLVAGQVVVRIVKFAVVVLAARMLGLASYGIFAKTAAYLSLFFIAASFFHTLAPLQRELSSRSAEKLSLLGAHAPWRLIVGFLAVVAAVALAPVTHAGPLLVVSILGVSLYLDFLRDLIGAVFMSAEVMRDEALSLVTQTVTTLIVTVALVIHSPTAVSLALGYLSGSVAGMVSALVFARRHVSLKAVYAAFSRPTRSLFEECVRYGLGFGLAWMLTISFVFQLAVVIVGHFAPAATTGAVSLVMQILQESSEGSSSVIAGMLAIFAISAIPYLFACELVIRVIGPIVFRGGSLPFALYSMHMLYPTIILAGLHVCFLYAMLALRKFETVLASIIGIFCFGTVGLCVTMIYFGPTGLYIVFNAIYLLLVLDIGARVLGIVGWSTIRAVFRKKVGDVVALYQ